MQETTITGESNLVRRKDTAADYYLGANIASTATCHHDQDIANQICYESYARIETQCDTC